MPIAKEGGGWPRLEVYLPDEEIRRRVKLAAAAHNKKLSEYCVEAILERLDQDEEQSWTNLQKTVEELKVWQEQIRAKLGRKAIPDTAEIMRQLRRERTRAISGLR